VTTNQTAVYNNISSLFTSTISYLP